MDLIQLVEGPSATGKFISAAGLAGGVAVTTTGTQTLTNKTLTAPVLSGTITGTYTLDGTPTLDGVAITGTSTIANGMTLTTPVLTTPDINGGTSDSHTSLSIRDTSAAFDVTLAAVSSTTLTAGRTLTLDVVNAARTVKLSGNIDLSGSLTTSGDDALTLTTAGATNVTLPTSGTLATLAASAFTGATTIADGATLTTPIITSIKDTAGVVRSVFNATAKTITDASATSLFSVALTAGQVIGGVMHFMVHASDATDHQVIAGIATYSAENKAGVIVGTMTYATANEAKSVSAGTLTLSFTDTDDTNVATFHVQPTGSLTETTYTITYSLFPLRGVVTIL